MAQEFNKAQKTLTLSQKRDKSKKIKKVMKERLGIDCLQMLCEEESGNDEASKAGGLSVPQTNKNGGGSSKFHLSFSGKGDIDDYRMLMKEIGADTNIDGQGLSDAFLQKHGKAQREELNDFSGMFSVRDLLGYGAFGVVLHVKNRVTKEKSALKIIAKEKLSQKA